VKEAPLSVVRDIVSAREKAAEACRIRHDKLSEWIENEVK